MPLPREEGEPAVAYFLREYVIPGIVFFFMARWLIKNVVAPMVRDGFVPKKVKRNPNDDNEFISDAAATFANDAAVEAPGHAKME
jgi:hypothetical protein